MRHLFFLLLMLSTPLFAGPLTICPNLNAPMEERLKWAHTASQKSFWIGYSITRLMDRQQIMISNVTISGHFRSGGNYPTLQEWIYGSKPNHPTSLSAAAQSELDHLENKKHEKVWKEMAIFQLFQRGSAMPLETSVIDMTVEYGFKEPVFWIGSVPPQDSFRYLTHQFDTLRSSDEKCQLIGAFSVHPPELALPFFKNVLNGKEVEDVQKAAAAFAGDLDTPQVLDLLQNVVRTNASVEVQQAAIAGMSDLSSAEATKVLCDLALSEGDHKIRNTAMAMLEDRNDPAALKTLDRIAWFDPDSEIRSSAIAMMGERKDAIPLLLKIVDEHPSKETREVALQMLAETVAGREVLKDKIKN